MYTIKNQSNAIFFELSLNLNIPHAMWNDLFDQLKMYIIFTNYEETF